MLENLAAKNATLGLLIIVWWMTITNIFPIMFFVLPEIFIFLWIFLAKTLPWYIPYLAIVIWAILWEQLNFFLWYKYWEKILESRFLQKEISKKWIKKIQQKHWLYESWYQVLSGQFLL